MSIDSAATRLYVALCSLQQLAPDFFIVKIILIITIAIIVSIAGIIIVIIAIVIIIIITISGGSLPHMFNEDLKKSKSKAIYVVG